MTQIKIEGMTCNHCVMAVRRALSGVPGAEAVEVDLERGEATVQGDAIPGALLAAIQDEGFEGFLVAQ